MSKRVARKKNQKSQVTLPSDQDMSGRNFGSEELEFLWRVMQSGRLTSTRGTMVKDLQDQLSERFGTKNGFACSSGTAAIHIALAALDLEPGDEVITSPITDMGALAPILYQGCIPVFADVDHRTCNVTAETIEARVSDRTRAIIVTHLFGSPCEMAGIMEVGNRHGLSVIEDCAQAYLAEAQGQIVGTIGTIGCFSLQQGKQMTCGEGGFVITDDAVLARRMFLFINKAWGYGDERPDHYFLALNYRLSELQGAVALAQLRKLDGAIAQRISMASNLTEQLLSIPGISPPIVRAGDRHTFWRYVLHVDHDAGGDGAREVATLLAARGIASQPHYIQKPAFQCELFSRQRTFGSSRYPFTLAHPDAIDYAPERFPGVMRGLKSALVLPWNECYEEAHVSFLAEAITDAAQGLAVQDRVAAPPEEQHA